MKVSNTVFDVFFFALAIPSKASLFILPCMLKGVACFFSGHQTNHSYCIIGLIIVVYTQYILSRFSSIFFEISAI